MAQELPYDPMELIREVSLELEDAGIPEAEREAELIVTHISGIDRVRLWRDRPSLDPEDIKKIEQALERRVQREPIQYILGEVEFWGLSISVGPGVLIPRPETEMLGEEALKHIDRQAVRDVLDLCTGSGCLALALAKELPVATVTGTDISETALDQAGRNAIINGIANIRFIHGYLFGPVEGKRFDLIVSNPPYIPSDDIDILQPEVSQYEPREALDGGDDGLDFYRAILKEVPAHLRAGGYLLLELGIGQADAVAALAETAGLRILAIRKDLAGIERVLVARKP
jgi:release factor glutamine methyltransferase